MWPTPPRPSVTIHKRCATFPSMERGRNNGMPSIKRSIRSFVSHIAPHADCATTATTPSPRHENRPAPAIASIADNPSASHKSPSQNHLQRRIIGDPSSHIFQPAATAANCATTATTPSTRHENRPTPAIASIANNPPVQRVITGSHSRSYRSYRPYTSYISAQNPHVSALPTPFDEVPQGVDGTSP